MKSFAIALCCLCLGCGAISRPEPVRKELAKWLLDHPLIVLPAHDGPAKPGDTIQLAGQVKTAWGYMRQLDNSDHLAWSSSDGHIATVNADGLVTAVGPGTARITLECKSCLDPDGHPRTSLTFFVVRPID